MVLLVLVLIFIVATRLETPQPQPTTMKLRSSVENLLPMTIQKKERLCCPGIDIMKNSWNPFLKHIAHNPVQNNLDDWHYLLQNTSLWASGADSRNPLKAYPYQIPLVQWTEEAQRHISERWHSVQH
eukprot:scaffold1856_cov195-Skeletonema_menzelii.AAC.1